MDDVEDYFPSVGELESSFNKAALHLQSLAATLPSDKLLYFYARYKQAGEGSCNTPKPGFFDFKGKQKWDAWKSLGDMSKETAMREYISAMAEIDPEWELKVEGGGGKQPGSSWVRVSSLQQEVDDVNEEDKNPFDWVKENNINRIRSLDRKSLEEKDDNGMNLLHWAADRGYLEVTKCLLELMINVNEQDADGQTALHYAASCGHAEIIQLLLNHGADLAIQDSDGMLAEDCADDAEVKMLFKSHTKS